MKIFDDLKSDFSFGRILLDNATSILCTWVINFFCNSNEILQKDKLVESFDPITAAMDGRSREHVIWVQSIPKNMKISERTDGDVKARINDTNWLIPPNLALNFCTKFFKSMTNGRSSII